MATGITNVQRQQERWDEVVRDPSLRNLPYKVETNKQGQIVLSPHSNRHSKYQRALQKCLDEYAPEGEVYPEYALATSEGVKVADLVWVSPEREAKMDETGDPTSLAPEICIEVLSTSNTNEDIREKRELYREIGAGEIWVIGENGKIRFFSDEEIDRSKLAPECPNHV